MRTRQYFTESARALLRSAALLAQGFWHLGRHLFLRYPNPTWGLIVTLIVFYSAFKLAEARSERDRYSLTNARLIEQIDSIKNTK